MLIKSVLAPTKATLVNREDSSHCIQPFFMVVHQSTVRILM